MPISQNSSGATIPLQSTDIDRLLRGATHEAVAQKAYKLDPGFRKAFDHYASMPDLDDMTLKRLPELLLNRYYFKTWEREPVDDLTATMSQGPQEIEEKEPGFLGRIKKRMEQGGQGALEATDDFYTGKQGLTDTLLQSSASIFSGAVAPATEAIDTVVGGTLRKTGLDKQLAKGVQYVGDTPIGQKAQELYAKAEEVAPAQLKTFKKVGKAVLDAGSILGTDATIKAGANITKAGAKKLVNHISEPYQKSFEEVVAKGVAKGIKPQSRSITKLSMQEYNAKAAEAVKQIIEKKDTFQFVDDAGDIIGKGRTPNNLSELAQAIQQSKKQLFDEYSALTQTATGKGFSIDLDDVVNKLIDYSDDPVKQLADPSKTAYALKVAERLSNQKTLNPSQVEDLIKQLNESLAPTYADKIAKGVSEVDLSVANILREKLDDAVTAATGTQYQPLKNAYGALKTIEKDVGHRALVVARQNTKGIADLSDIFTGGDLVAGIFTADPTFIVKGAAGWSIKSWYKNLVSPDANIMRMFSKAQKSLTGSSDDVVRNAGIAAQANNLDDIPLDQLSPKAQAENAIVQKLTGRGMSPEDANAAYLKYINKIDDTPQVKDLVKQGWSLDDARAENIHVRSQVDDILSENDVLGKLIKRGMSADDAKKAMKTYGNVDDVPAVQRLVKEQGMSLNDARAETVHVKSQIDDIIAKSAVRPTNTRLPKAVGTPLKNIPNTKGFVYHATTKEGADKILRSGLSTTEGKSFLAPSPDIARSAVSDHIADPVILKIPVKTIKSAFTDPNMPKGTPTFYTDVSIPSNVITQWKP